MDWKQTSLPQVNHFSKRLYLCFRLYVEMSGSPSNAKKDDIWSQIDLSQLTRAIALLGDRVNELHSETWRLNEKTRSTDSVWNELILLLHLDQTEGVRRSLYNIWKRNRHQIRDLVAIQTTNIANDANSDIDEADSASSEIVSVSSRKQLPLQTIVSSPIPVRPTREIRRDNSPSGNRTNETIGIDHSIVFSVAEWKKAYSQTNQKMKEGWTKIFADKLTASGFVCTLQFKSPVFKKGERKKNCRFFFCYAKCATKICARTFHIVLPQEPSPGTALLVLVRTYGEANHDAAIETSARQLKGEERFVVGTYTCSLYRIHSEHVCFLKESVPTRSDRPRSFKSV